MAARPGPGAGLRITASSCHCSVWLDATYLTITHFREAGARLSGQLVIQRLASR